MTSTNYERDFDDYKSKLAWPGRFNPRLLQNIDDVGDGYPGLQKAIRNYFHEGYLEKDIDLATYGIKGTSVDISNAELQQLSNIGSSIISVNEWEQIARIGATQISLGHWTIVGQADQDVRTTDPVTHLRLTLSQTTGTAPMTISSTTVVTNLNADRVDGHHMDQDVLATSNVDFGQITMSGDIIMGADDITFTTGLVDGVDISLHDHSTGDKGVNVPFTSLSGSIAYPQVSAIVDISGVGTADYISSALHKHTDSDGSSKIVHDNTTGITENNHHAKSHLLHDHIDPTSNIGMGTKKFVNLGAGSVAGDSVRYEQLHDAVSVNAPIVLTGQDIELKNDVGNQITEIDTSALVASDTKIPTNTTVKEYVDGQLHDQSHVLSGGDHTASGLTIGNVIRASGATTFAWAKLGHGDLDAIGTNAHSVIDTHLGSSAIHFTYPIQVMNSSAKQNSLGSYTKLKETEVYTNETSVKFYWEHARVTSGTGYSKLYKNGSPVGVEKVTASSSYAWVNDTISVAVGDNIEIWGYNNDSPTGGISVRNFYFEWRGGKSIL